MYYIYILSNRWHSVFYTGLTNDIHRRISEHKSKVFKSAFTRRFNVDQLLYYEEVAGFKGAIAREQEIKKLHRQYKMQLIMRINPALADLAADWTA
jgi:putative endonuclease